MTASYFPISRGSALLVGLVLLLAATGCPARKAPTNSSQELTTALYAFVKGGKGSGVVGGPIEGVEVTATLGDKVVGPVLTDGSGSFSLDGSSFLPPDTGSTQEALRKVSPVTVDVKFYKPGYKTQVEVVPFPLNKSQELVFYLTGT